MWPLLLFPPEPARALVGCSCPTLLAGGHRAEIRTKTRERARESERERERTSWLRTKGVDTNGAAAKVMNFGRSGKKVRPGTFGKIKVG